MSKPSEQTSGLQSLESDKYFLRLAELEVDGNVRHFFEVCSRDHGSCTNAFRVYPSAGQIVAPEITFQLSFVRGAERAVDHWHQNHQRNLDKLDEQKAKLSEELDRYHEGLESVAREAMDMTYGDSKYIQEYVEEALGTNYDFSEIISGLTDPKTLFAALVAGMASQLPLLFSHANKVGPGLQMMFVPVFIGSSWYALRLYEDSIASHRKDELYPDELNGEFLPTRYTGNFNEGEMSSLPRVSDAVSAKIEMEKQQIDAKKSALVSQYQKDVLRFSLLFDYLDAVFPGEVTVITSPIAEGESMKVFLNQLGHFLNHIVKLDSRAEGTAVAMTTSRSRAAIAQYCLPGISDQQVFCYHMASTQPRWPQASKFEMAQ